MKLFSRWGLTLLSAVSACAIVLFFLLLFSSDATAIGLQRGLATAAGTSLLPLTPPQRTVYTYTYQYSNSSGTVVSVRLPYTLHTYYEPPYIPLLTDTTATWDFTLRFEQGQYQAAFWVREREGIKNVHGMVLREIEVIVHCEVAGGVLIGNNSADFQRGFLRCFVPLQVSYQRLASTFFDNYRIPPACYCHHPFVEVTTTVRSTGQNPFVYVDAGQFYPELESYLQMAGSQGELHFGVVGEQYQSDFFTPTWGTVPGSYDLLRSEHVTSTMFVDHYQQSTLIGHQPASEYFRMQTGAMTFYVGLRPTAPPVAPTWLDGSLQGVLVDPGCFGY